MAQFAKMWRLLLVIFLLHIIRGVPVKRQGTESGLQNANNDGYLEEDTKQVDRGKREASTDIMNLVHINVNLDGKGEKGDTCKACKTAVALVKFLSANNKSEEELLTFATNICFDFKIMTKPLCEGLLKINGPALLYIIQNSEMNPSELCSFLVKFDCDEEPLALHQWKVDIPEEGNMSEPQKEGQQTSKPLKVLHISDTHFDPHYLENVPDDCSQPLCCRADSGEKSENSSLSGKWGGWKCDIPEKTLDNLLEHIARQHKDIDYVIWTGDIPPHDSWSMLKEESLSIFDKTVSKILKTFPDIPVYPALGNHEAVPPNLDLTTYQSATALTIFPLFYNSNAKVNALKQKIMGYINDTRFPPASIGERWSVEWLYSQLEKEWSNWIPDNSSETIRRGAFYTIQNRPGLRIVSLNTNYCYYGNWWLILNSTDPEQELAWLVEVLREAEENGEKVHIIGHIPPGHTDCLKTWQTNYYDIIQRFRRTVAAQFFGHTHTDEFELFYDKENPNNAINVAYIAPSVTTYPYLNPGYRIYYVDGDGEGSTRSVLDHETWFMDLEEANAEDNPSWRKLYEAKEAFNMTSLTPEDWHEVYVRMTEDDELFDSYDKFFWTKSSKRSFCDKACKKERLCGIRSCIQYGEFKISTKNK